MIDVRVLSRGLDGFQHIEITAHVRVDSGQLEGEHVAAPVMPKLTGRLTARMRAQSEIVYG